ncbi:MAG: DsrE family protein [Thermoanaerobacteraceae bacterium]|nr:DsrE family protein [Thermoanaerobacteraceae bacterium]
MDNNELYILWTSGDKEVAQKMVFMYTYNSKLKKWWDDVTLIVWGPSSKLLSEDVDLQEKVKDMQAIGIKVLACKACADQYGVTEKLESLNIEVIYMGEPLTELLKSGKHILTF